LRFPSLELNFLGFLGVFNTSLHLLGFEARGEVLGKYILVAIDVRARRALGGCVE
jgi:hypothetical protein